jgi:hypothetical protein
LNTRATVCYKLAAVANVAMIGDQDAGLIGAHAMEGHLIYTIVGFCRSCIGFVACHYKE